MTYRLTHGAQRDMREIDDWVQGEFGTRFAEATYKSLHDTFNLLTRYPQLGFAQVDEKKRPVRFFHLKPYWIIYQTSEPLLVHRVYHAARDLSRVR